MKLLNLDGKIVIAVSSGIACYKAIEVIRELQKRGYENIETVLTKNTVNFLSPNLFEAITGKKPHIDVFEGGRLLSHIKVVENAKVFAVLPATANILGKLANGIADDFLSTCYLAHKGKTLIFPSMNVNMLEHPATKRNLEKLKQDGCTIIEPESGYLACGYQGKGRLPEITQIADYIELYMNLKTALKGKKILITSGGTEEPIDTVRVITNRSSGRMGKALARFFSFLGAETTIITGNHTVTYPAYSKVVRIKTVDQMFEQVKKHYPESDAIVMAAAVSDFKVKNRSNQKIKKKSGIVLELEKTTDILEYLGKRKKDKIVVGFAAETEKVKENGKEKLERKNADLMVANKVGENEGFETDFISGYFIHKKGEEAFNLTKEEAAYKIALFVSEYLSNG